MKEHISSENNLFHVTWPGLDCGRMSQGYSWQQFIVIIGEMYSNRIKINRYWEYITVKRIMAYS